MRLALVSVVVIGILAAPVSAQQCLHGRSETPDQRARREQALRMAHQINLAQMAANPKAPNAPGSGRPFRPLNELANVPPAPAGFTVNLLTDGETYAFSIKDTRDPCHFTIFSDQERWIFEATPTTKAMILPVTTP